MTGLDTRTTFKDPFQVATCATVCKFNQMHPDFTYNFCTSELEKGIYDSVVCMCVCVCVGY